MSNVKATQRKLYITEARIAQFGTLFFILFSNDGRDIGKMNSCFTG